MPNAVLVVALGDLQIRRFPATAENLRRALVARGQLFKASLREYLLTGQSLEASVRLRAGNAPSSEPGVDVTAAAMYGFIDIPQTSAFDAWERAVELAHAEMSRLDAEVEQELAAEDAEQAALAGIESLA